MVDYGIIDEAKRLFRVTVPLEEGGTRVAGALRALRERVGIGSTHEGLDCSKSLISKLAENALADPCMRTNPRDAGLRDIEVIYEQTV